MILLSILLSLVYLAIYDFFKRDIFGLEKAKEFINNWKIGRNYTLRWIAEKTDKRKWLTFVLLAFWKDSFYATIFWRKPEQRYKGLSTETWGILLLAVIIENAPWILTISGVVWAWKFTLAEVWPYVEGRLL